MSRPSVERIEQALAAADYPDAPTPRAADRRRALAVAALFEPETVTTAAELDALPDESVIRDSMGDIGIVDDLYVHYPETARLTRGYVAKRYLPATVLHRGGDR